MNQDRSNLPEAMPAGTTNRRRWLAVGVVVLLLVAGALAARPAYHRFTRWRSHHLAAQAEEFLARTNWAQANQTAGAAYMLNPADPMVIHTLARVLTQATNPAALPYWRQLIITDRASPADRRDYVSLALRAGAVGDAADELQRLLNEETNVPADFWLASQLYTALRDQPRATYYASRAQQLDPRNEQYQLFLSSLLYDAPDAGRRATARNNVWTVARGSGPFAADAIGFLAARSDLTAGETQGLLTLLQQQPAGGDREWQILDLQIRHEPARRAEILDAAVARYQAAPAETLRQFGLWLNQHGEYQRTLAVLPRDTAMRHKSLFLVYLDTLAQLNQWDQLKDILDNENVPLEDVYKEAFRARCDRELGNAAGAVAHWRWAVSGAERNPPQLAWLAAYAEQLGQWDAASNALRSLVICLNDPRPAYAELEELVEKTGSTADLRGVVGEMLRRWPKDPALRNDYAYLSALLGQELPDACAAATELAQRYPNLLTHRTTLALACYRLGNYPAALGAYDGQFFDWSQASPSQRAVYAVVLAANGQTAAARQQLQSIRKAGLRPEELELLHPLQ